MMKMPSMLEAATGAFSTPAIKKLRELGMSNMPIHEKRKLAFPLVGELKAYLDSIFNSDMLGAALKLMRITNKELPTAEEWLEGWNLIKERLNKDKKYVLSVCDMLPVIFTRYDGANGIKIFGDPDLRYLASKGMQ